MKQPHLVPGLLALFLAGCLAVGFSFHARTLEGRYVHALAPDMFHQKSLGNAIQKATLQQPDLLPMYGSSEMRADNAYDGAALFEAYPTGFDVSRIGFELQSLLCVALQLAGDGSQLRGKKVVLIADRGTVLEYGGNWEDNFSALEAKELVFSSDLSFGLKQRIAKEMVKSPRLLAKDPLLEFATQRLAAGGLADRAAYFALFPLGKLNLWIMRLQDHWEVLAYIRGQKGLQATLPHDPAVLDWSSLVAEASAHDAAESGNNVFGINDTYWDEHKADFRGPNLPGLNLPRPGGPGPGAQGANASGPNAPGPGAQGADASGPNAPGPGAQGADTSGPNGPAPGAQGANAPAPNGPVPGSSELGAADLTKKSTAFDAWFVRSTSDTPWNQLRADAGRAARTWGADLADRHPDERALL